MAFVTCRALPEMHDDDRRAADVLRGTGLTVVSAVWDDAAVDWTRFACVVIRSTWDYHLDHERYADWLQLCKAEGVNLWNPPDAVLTNLDKRYLRDLANAGRPVIPTHYLDAGEPSSLRALLETHDWPEAVVKPAVSASAYGTWRTSLEQADADQARFEQDIARHALLVQPLAPEIAAQGEWSLMFFAGEYSHAVLKRPSSGDFRVQEELGGAAGPAMPSPRLIKQARAILAQVRRPLLYARIDGIERDGQFVLMELEINEPYLYLGSSFEAADRFADAIGKAMERQRPAGSEDPAATA